MNHNSSPSNFESQNDDQPNESYNAWQEAMKDILRVKSEGDIPELNIYQCGTCAMHSLDEAKEIATKMLDRGIGVMNNDELKLDEKLLGK